MTNTVLRTKISKVENKIPDHAKYINTPEFNKLTAEHFAASLKQADLVNISYFDNKLTSFKLITSNKTKNLKVQKRLNSLMTIDFFLGRLYFASNAGSQTMFFYQPTLDTLELKKVKGTDYLLSWKLKGVYNSKLKFTLNHDMPLSNIA